MVRLRHKIKVNAAKIVTIPNFAMWYAPWCILNANACPLFNWAYAQAHIFLAMAFTKTFEQCDNGLFVHYEARSWSFVMFFVRKEKQYVWLRIVIHLVLKWYQTTNYCTLARQLMAVKLNLCLTPCLNILKPWNPKSVKLTKWGH